jgi:hypothetical protein
MRYSLDPPEVSKKTHIYTSDYLYGSEKTPLAVFTFKYRSTCELLSQQEWAML